MKNGLFPGRFVEFVPESRPIASGSTSRQRDKLRRLRFDRLVREFKNPDLGFFWLRCRDGRLTCVLVSPEHRASSKGEFE
jgi:hypothetical protein